jgi:hypothetical protein
MRPPGFAHPSTKDEITSTDDQPAKSYATRAKLTAPTPVNDNNWARLNDRIKLYHMRQHLLVTNRGPKEEGYTYCIKCGLIEPTAISRGGVVSAPHKKPYPDQRDESCPGGAVTKGLVLGTDFITDVLLVSLSVESPIALFPGLLATDVVLRTVCEAITRAACESLEIEPNELQAEYRPALTQAGREGREAEIYIYDTLSGGAGFARRVGNLGISLFEIALNLLENCPDRCDRSCYRCLRSYKNKFEHDLLDRHVGASLLRFLIAGVPPSLDSDRLEKSTDLLFDDITRQQPTGFTIDRNKLLNISGIGSVQIPILISDARGPQLLVGLHDPLTRDYPCNPDLMSLKQYGAGVPLKLIDELVVRRNLPSATSMILDTLSGA